jgi:hypothetical protein
MFRHAVLTAITISLFGGVDSPSQQAAAQVVMLPTYRTFSIGGSVLVPDRGMAHLGGISTARESRVSRGIPGFGPLFANRGIGREMGHAGAHVAATIIDNRELDQQVLSAAARSLPAVSAEDVAIARKAAFLNQHLGSRSRPSGQTAGLEGLPENHISRIRQQQQQADQQQQLEGLELMIQAQQMELAGKPGVARIYYQQAARRLTGNRRQQVIERLRAIEAIRQTSGGR